jgi:hypothetical protein
MGTNSTPGGRRPGSSWNSAQRTIEVVTGNGGGVRAFFQGEDTGLMGEFGEAVIRIWSEGGLITPTPTATPQITATQPVPATGTPSPGG